MGPAKPLYYGQTYVPEGTSFRDALVALYHSTDGANWNNNRNWLSDEPLDEWFGVTTDDDGRVIELDLSQNQLTGEIPAEIGRLTDLQDLDLFGNQLRGEIRPEIGSLANVTRLALWANQLTGEIPAEFGNLASLEWVALGINELSGELPPELGNLTNLAEADFTLNQFSGEIPAELGNLINLTWLVFWSNKLSGEIPPELGNLTNLRRLFLAGGNELTGCLPEVWQGVPDSDLDELDLPFCGAEDPA